MKVIMISEKRLDELFDALKSKLAENPRKTGSPEPLDNENINHRTFVYHFEGLRRELKDGNLGV
jgi:hypothetical protein